MPERKKWFCKTQKYELQLLPAACCFHKNELELFWEDWHRRPPASPDASGLPAFPPLSSIFFTSFPFSVPSIFQFLCRQLTYTACNTSSSVLPVVRTLHFHHFSFEAFSFFRKSLRLLPASAGRHLTRSILTNSQARTSHAGFAGHTPPVTFSFEAFSFFRKSLRLLPVSAGRHLTRSILIHTQVSASHSGFAGHTPPVTFSFKAFSAFHQSSHFLPASAGHYFRYIILT